MQAADSSSIAWFRPLASPNVGGFFVWRCVVDELTRWQMEERARQARVIRELAESGAVEKARSALEQVQVFSNPDFRAAAERAAAQIEEFNASLAKAALVFEATYGEVIAIFVRLHQMYAGVGSTFTVTSDEGGPEGATTHERLLSLPADNVAVGDGELRLSGHVEAKVIKGSASATLDNVTSSATGRILEASASLAGTSTLSASATVITHC